MMASTNSNPLPVPATGPATDELINGPTKTRTVVAKRAAGKVKNTKVDKMKATAGQTRSRGAGIKKAVNSYIIFRSMMSPVFTTYTQADRSRFIRTMWASELHKTSYGLMARVWTFIRDNTNYRCLPQFLAGAGIICGIVPPDTFLQLYNMMLVRMPVTGRIELLQAAPPAPGRIPAPRDLSDFDLLHELLLKGLPVERPAQLLQQMAEHSLHVMTVNRKQDFPVHDETLGEAGRAITGFTQQMDFNPISTFADLLQMESTNSFFDFGVNVIDVEDISNFDSSAVVATGPQTHYRFQWDSTTAHHAQPESSAIDNITPEHIPKIFDLDQPNQWDNLCGQMTQREYEAGKSHPK